MTDLAAQIDQLEAKANSLQQAKKYLEALKKYEEVIQLKREAFGEKAESTLRTSSEAAIVCNILSMSFLQKGNPQNHWLILPTALGQFSEHLTFSKKLFV